MIPYSNDDRDNTEIEFYALGIQYGRTLDEMDLRRDQPTSRDALRRMRAEIEQEAKTTLPVVRDDSHLTLSQILLALASVPVLWFLLCLAMRVCGCEWPEGLF